MASPALPGTVRQDRCAPGASAVSLVVKNGFPLKTVEPENVIRGYARSLWILGDLICHGDDEFPMRFIIRLGSGGQPVGRCSIESLEEATDNHSRMLGRSDVRSNTCTKLDQVFERVKHPRGATVTRSGDVLRPAATLGWSPSHERSGPGRRRAPG